MHCRGPSPLNHHLGRTQSCVGGGLPPKAGAPVNSAERAYPRTPANKASSRPAAQGELASSPTAVDELKAAVRRAVSGTARGKAATRAQRAEILGLLQQLEAQPSEPDPVASPYLSGWWALLYQAPLDEARAEQDKSGTLEGPFLAAFQPLTRGLIRTKANTQLIDLAAGRAENVAEFVVLGGLLEGSLNIQGTAAPLAPTGGELVSRRVLVQFTHFHLRLGGWSTRVSLESIKPTGWIETTYLDEQFRVGRGDKGSIFVAAKMRVGRESMD